MLPPPPQAEIISPWCKSEHVAHLSNAGITFVTAISTRQAAVEGGSVEQGWSWHDFHVVSALLCGLCDALLRGRLVGGLLSAAQVG
jgi:hypothetical protein